MFDAVASCRDSMDILSFSMSVLWLLPGWTRVGVAMLQGCNT
jgi:hypothetical protein